MPERVELWWTRRQFSKGADVPYAVGTYREAWAAFPALIRQYHPELNAGIALTQIPPAADVLLLWQCEAGHAFAATPDEQRSRPGRERRRSAWCPDCSQLARPTIARPMRDAVTPPGVPSLPMPAGVPTTLLTRRKKRPLTICPKTPDVRTGEPFFSECAPRPASAVEARVRADLFARVAVTPGLNAVRVARPFFQHVEVWPDILLPELRIAVEYDSIGRHGLEHVGRREAVDKRKDRALRGAGWEVIRIRTGKLQPIGSFDLQLAQWNGRGLDRVIDALRTIRGSLFVDPYLEGP
jgi:Probable Zinc-ribbon domain